MENNILKIAVDVQSQVLESLDSLIDGKLTQRTLDLGSHEMFIETREKRKTYKGEPVMSVAEMKRLEEKHARNRADMGGNLPELPEIPEHLQPQIKSKV